MVSEKLTNPFLWEKSHPHLPKVGVRVMTVVRLIFRFTDSIDNLTLLTGVIMIHVCRLWGSVNLLWCHRCEEYFPLSELGHCKYHPMPLDFVTAGIVGVFPCCQQRVLRFDAMGQRTVRSWIIFFL